MEAEGHLIDSHIMERIFDMRVYGIDAIYVMGPGSRDAYPLSYNDPGKFEGVLPVLWRDGADVIYGVPRRAPSLAHVVRRSDIAPRAPHNAEGQIVPVQVAYDPGWSAEANGLPAPVCGDGLGLIVIEASCTGPYRITLRYSRW